MFHTLALIGLVLLAAFAMATSTMSQLNLSARYAQRTQADNTARAAMAEFVIRVMQVPAPIDITVPAPPLLDQFRGNPVLLTPRPPLEGTAVLLPDRCVDNSDNPAPVASWFDSGGKTSVPPYSASVVYEVTLGSRKYLYESLLQQRWPYALAATGPMLITGRIGPAPGSAIATGPPSMFWSAPSEVKGRILALQTEVDIASDPGADEDSFGAQRKPTTVSDETYEALYPYARAGGVAEAVPVTGAPTLMMLVHRLTLGGPITLYELTKQWTGGEYPVLTHVVTPYFAQSEGAKIVGSIDLMENLAPQASPRMARSAPTVRIHARNEHRGILRRDHRLGGVDPKSLAGRRRMRELFAKPDTTSWPVVNISETPQDGIMIIGREGTSEGDVYYAPGGKARVQVASNDVFKPVKCGTPIDFSVASGGGRAAPNPVYTGTANGALMLEDVALAVDGDLVLEKYLLRGKNATLIVDGTLTMDGSYLDAGQNGMVIFCRRLIMRAQGEINGLIIAEKGAAIFGGTPQLDPPTRPGLTIRGGLLVGGNDIRLMQPYVTSGPNGQPNPEESNVLLPLEIKALTLVSTRIEYNPKYLRSLNRCGPYEVLATELRN